MKHTSNLDRSTRAFVLDLGTGGLGVVRSLGEVGIRVTGLDWEHWTPAAKSRYCVARRCPNPTTEPQALLDLLLAEGRQLEQPAVLLPCSDAFVLFMSRYRTELAAYFRFALPSVDVIEAIVDKHLLGGLAEQVGTPYPQTFHPESFDDIQRIKHAVHYPALLKPSYSHLWRPVLGNKGIRVNTPAELEERFIKVAPFGFDVLVQSLVPGGDSDFFHTHVYLDQRQQALALLTTRRIRQHPPGLGTSSLVESVHNDEVAQLGLKFLQGIGYYGAGSVLFKRDQRDGTLTLIEVNPRFWGHIRHSTICGINFPLIAYRELTQQAPRALPYPDYRAGLRWMDAVADLGASWTQIRRGELSPRGWVESLAPVRVTAHFDWRDPAPFFAANRYGLRYGRLLLNIIQDLRTSSLQE